MSDLNIYLQALHSGKGHQELIDAWQVEAASEVSFWDKWIETKGLQWRDEFIARAEGFELRPWLLKLLPSDGPAKVLDVGAGPITGMGHFVKGRPVEILAVDPLAGAYASALTRAKVRPPIQTRFAYAEELSVSFGPNTFDLVHCNNALDHAIDPLWGLLEMVIVAKPNGYVFLSHRRNEGASGNYEGLHHWNFDGENGDFIIWNPSTRHNVTELLSGFCDTTCEVAGEGVSVTIRKTGEPTFDVARHASRQWRPILPDKTAM
jgi:SAM-dependent methyltransferase